MQTILGAGGPIDVELAKALPKYTDKIRLVSRNPKRINDTDELVSADLTQAGDIEGSIAGSSIVYVTVGFPYSIKYWRTHWPVFIRRVVEACVKHNTKLVFFDNIYMYDKSSLGHMTEEAAINPPSKKGKVRAEVAKIIMDRVQKGELTALIARSADFYGPSISNTSMLTETVFKPLSQGKKANWMGPVSYKHSFTYTPDAGKASAILGNTESAYGQVWHLPTAGDPPTGKEWIDLVGDELKKEAKCQAAPKWIIQLCGIFVPVLREMPEMMYQYDRDYIFDSSKFEKAFNYKPTSYQAGIKEIIHSDYR